MQVFEKTLAPTDVNHRFSVPIDSLEAFCIPKGSHQVDFQAMDANDHPWLFRLWTRPHDSHPKPVFSAGWLQFVHHRGLRVGDKVILCQEKNQVHGAPQFRIYVQKQLPFTILGQTIWSAYE